MNVEKGKFVCLKMSRWQHCRGLLNSVILFSNAVFNIFVRIAGKFV